MVSKKEDLIFVVSLVILCLLLLMKPCCSQTDTLQQGPELKEGKELLSVFGKFKFGFFSPYDDNLYGRYLGVWYNRVAEDSTAYYRKVVWVANRNSPISEEASELMVYIDTDFNLKISYTNDRCSSPVVLKLTSVVDELHAWNSTLRLLETGNLVLSDKIISSGGNNTDRVFWQSFDYPTDTLLPGMKIGTSLKTGHNWSLTSTRRNSDNYFAQGSYTLGMEDNYQLVIRWLGDIYWKSGHFENQSFALSKDPSYNSFMTNQSFNTRTLNFSYNSNENEIYYTYSVDDAATPFPLLQITYFGELQFGDDVLVSCPSRGTDECVSKGAHNCRKEGDYYISEYGIMSRDGFIFKQWQNMSDFDCRDKCFYNCSCVAFTLNYINGTYNCEFWTRGAHFRKSKRSDARLIYIMEYKIAENKWRLWLIISIAGGVFVILFSYCCWVIWRKFKTIVEREKQMRLLVLELQGRVQPRTVSGESTERENNQTNELKIFSFESIASATNKFSIANKLGEGGFGPVYKGILPDGQEIAIKRLSKSSGQGLEEFKNEAILIARLQHTTLVRIIGCCVQRQERILIYEYLPNKSLDFFIFGNQSRKLLNWKARFNIIEGIAQGLLYLHKYSRLRVIHRDLKASNILLDDKMNPKISDFGMARIFGLNQSEANTNRVVGTYGYMSPEYAMNGVVSTKTDVYSFGVLLLEILSGKKNNSSYSFDRPLNLVGHAWVMWNEGRALELLDETIIDEEYSENEVMRCIHVGLLCVQDFAKDRPNMVEVVPMLANEMMPLPELNQPAYFIGSVVQEQDTPEMEPHSFSTNDVTISVLEAR